VRVIYARAGRIISIVETNYREIDGGNKEKNYRNVVEDYIRG